MNVVPGEFTRSKAEDAVLKAQLPELHAFLASNPECAGLSREYLVAQERLDACFDESDGPFDDCQGLLLQVNVLARQLHELGCRIPDVS